MCRLLRAFTLFISQLVTVVLSAQGKRKGSTRLSSDHDTTKLTWAWLCGHADSILLDSRTIPTLY